MRAIRRLFGEPMVVFLLVGGVCFAAYGWLTPGSRPAILVDDGMKRRLIANEATVLGRPLEAMEAQTAVQKYVDDEILFRAALERGLHLDDFVTRERLVDKMRFLLAEEPAEPDEATLRRHFEEHRSDYRTLDNISFDHVFFEAAPPDPAALRRRLDGGADFTRLGAPFWLGARLEAYDRHTLVRTLGEPFTDRLFELQPGRWSEVLESTRGHHLVRVTALARSRPLTFDEARLHVHADWMQAERERHLAAALDELRGNYDVEIAP